MEEPDTNIEIGNNIYEPDKSFVETYDKLIIQPLKVHPKTQYPHLIYGYDHDYNRLNVIEYGRTNFDQGTFEHSSMDKVNLYCFYNMRKHYFSSMAIFKSFNDYFKSAFGNSNNRINQPYQKHIPQTTYLLVQYPFEILYQKIHIEPSSCLQHG